VGRGAPSLGERRALVLTHVGWWVHALERRRGRGLTHGGRFERCRDQANQLAVAQGAVVDLGGDLEDFAVDGAEGRLAVGAEGHRHLVGRLIIGRLGPTEERFTQVGEYLAVGGVGPDSSTGPELGVFDHGALVGV
jgi:hypothetical protein